MHTLSSLQRPEYIDRLKGELFDLIVIGGGITGAGIALDAASRGLKTALLEKNDFASGTSSKSTKLIHGGLRYLKQLEINLVREVGRERAAVHRLAPHLVVAEKMLLPLIKGGTYGELATSMGLWVYDVLAGVEGDDRRTMLNQEETLQKEPLLRKDGLKGGGFYAEYRTDDARLTIENIKTAGRQGALCLNYVEVQDFVYDAAHQVKGVQCRDQETGQQFSVMGNYVISATGPWVDQLRKINDSLKGKHLFLSKGIHIVVPHRRFPVRQAVYFDIPDGRMIFAIPRQRVTYIGTTDTPYSGDLHHISILREEVEYLLDACNAMFPDIHLSISDVESSWAGLRPLIHEEGKSASEMSRKDEIFESETGLISIAGGKLTGYRRMAERIVDLLRKKLQEKEGRQIGENRTRQIPLTGGPFAGAEEVESYKRMIHKALTPLGLTDYHAHYLVNNYGRQTDLILDRIFGSDPDPEVSLARAETWYVIHHESGMHLLDFFDRRTGRLYFHLPGIQRVLDPVAQDFAHFLNWDEATRKKEKNAVLEAIRQATAFEPAENERPASSGRGASAAGY